MGTPKFNHFRGLKTIREVKNKYQELTRLHKDQPIMAEIKAEFNAIMFTMSSIRQHNLDAMTSDAYRKAWK